MWREEPSGKGEGFPMQVNMTYWLKDLNARMERGSGGLTLTLPRAVFTPLQRNFAFKKYGNCVPLSSLGGLKVRAPGPCADAPGPGRRLDGPGDCLKIAGIARVTDEFVSA